MKPLTAAMIAVQENVELLRGKPGKDGRAGKAAASGLTWRGPWVSMQEYEPGDVVEIAGSAYVCTATTSRKPPGEGWDLLAAKGTDGASRGFPRGLSSGLVVDDEGTRLNGGTVVGEIDFAGAGVSAAMSGGKAVVTIAGGGGGGSLTVKDEGSNLDTAVTSLDFTGAGVTATNVGHAVTVAVAGGGVTNSAPAGSVAVSDGTNLVGSANLTWDAAEDTLGLADEENGLGIIAATGVGAQLQIKAGDGDATHTGGELSLTTGNSAGNNSGDLTISTGSDTDGGDSGAITIQTGGTADGESGTITIYAGLTGDSAVGGRVIIHGGVGQTGNGGHVQLQAGHKVTGGSHGAVRLYSALGNQSVELNESGLFLNGEIVGTQAANVPAVATGGLVLLSDVITALGALQASHNDLLAKMKASNLMVAD